MKKKFGEKKFVQNFLLPNSLQLATAQTIVDCINSCTQTGTGWNFFKDNRWQIVFVVLVPMLKCACVRVCVCVCVCVCVYLKNLYLLYTS